MAKYKAEFETSGEIIEHEGVSFKSLYDVVKSELRWSLTHMDITPSDLPFERVHFYKKEAWGWSYQFLMTARCSEFWGKGIITLVAPNNNWRIIWKEKQA